MLIFMKNVKKFIRKDSPVLSAIHYHAGRAYATNAYSLVWIEDSTAREGVFDAESGVPVEDVKMPTISFDKAVPKVDENSAYVIVGNDELTQLLSVLKSVDACAPNRKDSDSVMLVWRASGLTVYARGASLRAAYSLSGKTENLADGALRLAMFNARLLSVLIDYLRQRKGATQFYAPQRIISPLRVDMLHPCAKPSGIVLAAQRFKDVACWADVVPEDVLCRCIENVQNGSKSA